MVGQPGLFDLSERLAELSSKGKPLERLGRLVDTPSDEQTEVEVKDRQAVVAPSMLALGVAR